MGLFARFIYIKSSLRLVQYLFIVGSLGIMMAKLLGWQVLQM